MRYCDHWGLPLDEYTEIRRVHGRTPFAAYSTQRNNARHRGIQWEFTFPEWWAIWEPHWQGRGRSGLCMSRPGDVGPYSPTNVRIIPARKNMAEARLAQFMASLEPYLTQ